MPFFRRHTVRAILAGILIFVSGASNTTIAQTVSWNTPSSGYIFDAPSQSIRQILGFIGSAQLGPALLSGIEWASIAPNQKSALVSTGGSMVLIPDIGVPGQARRMGRTPQTQQVFWAADSSRAVGIAAGGQLIWFKDLAFQPVPEVRQSLAGLTGQPNEGAGAAVWTLLAADSIADTVLLASKTRGASRIWLASSTAAPTEIAFSGNAAAAVFSSSNTMVFVADAVAHAIIEIQGLAATPTITTLSSTQQQGNDPACMVLSSDGQRLFLADRTDGMIRIFDSSTGSLVSELASDATPASFSAFAQDRFLLNTSGANRPLLFVDTSLPAKVSFVPRAD